MSSHIKSLIGGTTRKINGMSGEDCRDVLLTLVYKINAGLVEERPDRTEPATEDELRYGAMLGLLSGVVESQPKVKAKAMGKNASAIIREILEGN